LYDFVLPVLKIFLNYSSGKFSILAKFWISFKSQLIDPKFHGDHEYVGYFDDSSMVEELWLLPVYFRYFFKKIASELCSVYSSQYCKFDFKLKNRIFKYLSWKTWLLFLSVLCNFIGMSLNNNCFVFIQVMQRKRREDGHQNVTGITKMSAWIIICCW
jgi:hypothetical protein